MQTSDFVTLTAAARITGLQRGTLEQRIRRGTLQAEKREGVWYVCLPTETPTQAPTEDVQASYTPRRLLGVQSQVGTTETVSAGHAAEEGMWQAIAEQTDLVERLQAELRQERQNHLRDMELAERRLADMEDRTIQLETMRQCDRAELTRVGQVVGAYRQPQTREERQATEVYEGGRSARTGFLARLVGQ